MSLSATNEAWETLRSFIDPNDRTEAADALVNMLIENGNDADDIRSEFNDRDIKTALTAYLKDHPEDEEDDWDDEEEDDYDDEDEEW
jgi:hypothetical protein